MPIQKSLLAGTPDDIRVRVENLSRGLAPHEYSADERLRALAVELARHADLQMWLLTYNDESQELEVTLSGDRIATPSSLPATNAASTAN
jgi:hypothetical protein